MQSVLKIWFLATAVLLAGAVIWAFAPVLVVVLLVTVGLGLLVSVIVTFARWLERKRGRPNSS
jgi:hypothetical protein